MSFQSLATTPSVQAMNDNLLRNMWSYREIDGGVDQGEETESAHEEDEDVEIEVEEEVQEQAVSSPPPQLEVEVEVEVAAKEKKSPKLYIPVRIWNEVGVGARVDAQAVQKAQEVQDPKVNSPKRKRVSLVLHHEVEASEGQVQEQEAEAAVEERGRRKRTKTLKASQNEEISRAKTNGASRSRGHATSRSTSKPATRSAAATAPRSHSRGSQNAPLSASALALETAARALAIPIRAATYSASSSTVPTPPLTPPTPPPKEGPRAAWHRLFPHHPSLSDYYHIGEWRELMVWKEAKGYIKRTADDPWEKPVFRKPGWNRHDEEMERLWQGCERRMVKERGWTYEGRVAGDEGMVRAAERGWGVGGWEG